MTLPPPYDCFAEDQLVVDEELTPQHTEQEDAGDDVGDGGGHRHAGLESLRALAENRQQHGDGHHGKGIQLAQPGHGDGGEAHASGHAVVQRVVGPGATINRRCR